MAVVSSGSRRRVLAWIGIFTAVIALLVVATVDTGGVESDGERVQRLNSSFACPTCRGQSVAESNAAVAVNIRQFIADEVTDGSSDEQIRDRLLDAYDARVLLNPPAQGFAALVWVLPVVVAVLGAVALGAALTRSQAPDRRASSEDQELLDRARALVDRG